MLLTKTWLEESNAATLIDSAPPNLNFLSISHRRGGIAILNYSSFQREQKSFVELN